jgi:hypothetical protein
MPEKVKCLDVIKKIKDTAARTSENPRKIIRTAQTVLDEESSKIMTRQRNLTQMIHRVRILKINDEKNPTSLDEVSESIPPSLRNTYRNELFYFGDCGTDKNKIFIFSTPNNMLLCNNIHDWYVDGTFDIASSLFKQVFTQHVILKGRCLPMVYALLPNKKESVYRQMFNLILNHIDKTPKTISCDFEKAIINAITKSSKLSEVAKHLKTRTTKWLC